MARTRPFAGNIKPLHASVYEDADNFSDDEEILDHPSEEDVRLDSDIHAESSEGSGHDVAGENRQDIHDAEDYREQMSNVSFGALLQAREALSKKRKRGSDTTAEQDAKLDALRARLQAIKSEKAARGNTKGLDRRKAGATSLVVKANRPTARFDDDGDDLSDHSDDDNEADSDSPPSEEESAPLKSRTSKHAPAARSSKYQVTRKRTVIDVPKRAYRDPRFDALHQGTAHTGNSDKAYGFLQDYQKSEIAELRAAIKQTRNENDKETLKRKVISMENRLKAKEAKDREQEVLRRHRAEEKGKVEQGKKPFFLKKKEVKERMLVDKFESMKSKDRAKLMERRRKKEGQKEKKRMPEARRMAG